MLKNPTIKRTIFGIIFLIFLIPAIAATAWGGEVGRIAGFVMFSIVGMIGLFEILTAMKYSMMASLVTSLVIPITMLLPFNIDLKNIFIYGGDSWALAGSGSNNTNSLISQSFYSWEPWVISLVFAVLPNLLDFKFKLNKHWFIKQLFVYILVFILPVFSEMAWILNIANFKYFAFFVLIAVISDTAGYFGGMLLGKKLFKGKKLAPKISPNKTWAGFIIGFIFSVTFAITYGYFMGIWSVFGNLEWLVVIIAAILLSFASPMGDLFFSAIKRTNNIKDFSNIIPGHGGIFDRLDSTSVVFVVGLLIYLFA